MYYILSAACTRSVYFSAFFLAYLITHTRQLIYLLTHLFTNTTEAWPHNRGDKLPWGHKGDHQAMAANFFPGRPYLKLRRVWEEEGHLSIFPRWEVRRV